MPEAKSGNSVEFLDLLLDYFADGARWGQGDLDDGHGRRCLVGAIHYLRRKHQLASGAAESLLQEALPHGHCHLALFNDHCADIVELRALIMNARTLAAAAAAQRPKRTATVQLGRWRVLVRLKRERADLRRTWRQPPPRAPLAVVVDHDSPSIRSIPKRPARIGGIEPDRHGPGDLREIV